MGKKDKLEDRIWACANDISMNEFDTFLRNNGFVLRKSNNGGSHRVYQIVIAEKRRSVTIVCPHGNKKEIAGYQIKEVLKLIKEKQEVEQ